MYPIMHFSRLRVSRSQTPRTSRSRGIMTTVTCTAPNRGDQSANLVVTGTTSGVILRDITIGSGAGTSLASTTSRPPVRKTWTRTRTHATVDAKHYFSETPHLKSCHTTDNPTHNTTHNTRNTTQHTIQATQHNTPRITSHNTTNCTTPQTT